MPEYLAIALTIAAVFFSVWMAVGVYATLDRPRVERALWESRFEADYALQKEGHSHDLMLFNQGEHRRQTFFETEIKRMVNDVVAQRRPDAKG